MSEVTTTEAKSVIPQNIERELSRKGWTRYRLAIEADISHATMHNICAGVHDPKASNLKSIADALGVKVDRLLTDPSEKSAKVRNSVAKSA